MGVFGIHKTTALNLYPDIKTRPEKRYLNGGGVEAITDRNSICKGFWGKCFVG